MKRAQALFRFVFFALLLLSGEVSAEGPSTVQVVGLSNLQGASLTAQREAAIQDALRNAVQQVVGVLLSTSTLVENYELVEDRIYSRAAGIAILSEIAEEGPTSTGLYRVVAEVIVHEAELAQELHALIRANGDPRILVEASGGAPANRSLTVAVLEDALIQQGFTVVIGANDESTGGAVGRTLYVGADLLARVEITEHENLNTPQAMRDAMLSSVTISSIVRLVEAASGRVVAVERATSTRVGSGRTRAAQEAAQQSAARLGDAVSQAAVTWFQASGTVHPVSVIVLEGDFDFSDIQQLITELETRHGASTTLRSFTSHSAVLEVTLTGRVQGILPVVTELGWEIIAIDGVHITASRE